MGEREDNLSRAKKKQDEFLAVINADNNVIESENAKGYWSRDDDKIDRARRELAVKANSYRTAVALELRQYTLREL
jgi:hypothetical protein